MGVGEVAPNPVGIILDFYKGLSHEVKTYGTQSECQARDSVTQEKHNLGLLLRMFLYHLEVVHVRALSESS